MCSQRVLEEKSKKGRKHAVSKEFGLSDMTRFLGCEGSCLVFKDLLVFRIRGECEVGLLNGNYLSNRPRDVGRTREEFVNHAPQASGLRIL